MTNATERTYSLTIKGEQHTYTFSEWSAFTFEQLVTVLSDLTGYRTDYLAKDLPKRFDRLGYAAIGAANNIGSTPTFLIRSADGGKP